MVEAGTAHRLLRTFLNLQKACEKASLSLTSDSDGNLNISLKVKVSGVGNQAPRKGGCQPRRQKVEPGTLAPSPATPAATLLHLQHPHQLQALPLPKGPGAGVPVPVPLQPLDLIVVVFRSGEKNSMKRAILHAFHLVVRTKVQKSMSMMELFSVLFRDSGTFQQTFFFGGGGGWTVHYKNLIRNYFVLLQKDIFITSAL